MKYLLYCDGATNKSNPSEITGAGNVCYLESPRVEVFRISQKLGRGTNNTAEYNSLIIGLENCLEKGINEIWVCMDSQLVIKQCKKEWQVKDPGLKPLNLRVMNLINKFKSVSFYWVPRDENKLADQLSKLALTQ